MAERWESESITRGPENDVIAHGDGNDTVMAGAGSDYIHNGDYDLGEFGFGDNDRIWGEDGDDIIVITPGHDFLFGGAGRDELRGAASTYRFGIRDPDTHVVDDSYQVKVDRVQMDAQDGKYRVFWLSYNSQTSSWSALRNDLGAMSGFEAFHGTNGNDTLLGSAAGIYSSLVGNQEWFRPGAGNDVIDGRDGWDILAYDFNPVGGGTGTGITVRWDLARVYDGLGGVDRFSNIEQVNGTAGADVFLGDDADNIMNGMGGGTDKFYGGGGFDRIWFQAGIGVTVNLAAGNGVNESGHVIRTADIEALWGSTGTDKFIGGDEANEFRGFGGDDTLFGGAGDDTIHPGSGNDVVSGGDDIDTVDYSVGTPSHGAVVRLYHRSADDPFDGTDILRDIENVIGSNQADIIFGDDADNRLDGLNGDDNLGGQAGTDRLYGGLGRDTLGGGDDRDWLYGDDDDDFLFGGAGRDALFGGEGDDRLSGDAGGDSILGGNGDDTVLDRQVDLNAVQFSDAVDARAFTGQAFTSFVLQRVNVVRGEVGEDTISGTGILYGGDEDDLIRGQGWLEGDEGNDRLIHDPTWSELAQFQTVLVGGLGNDALIGVAGGLTGASYDYSGTGVHADLQRRVVNAGPGDSDTLRDIRYFYGSSLNDVILGANTGSEIFGGDGEDQITLRGVASLLGERDFVNGGFGNDRITSSTDADKLVDGGPGVDTIIFRNAGFVEVGGGIDGDIIDVQAQKAVITGNAPAILYNMYDGVYDVDNDTGADTITARVDDLLLSAGPGDDLITIYSRVGETGYRRVLAGDGEDRIILRGTSGDRGDPGYNLISGEEGNDTIYVFGFSGDVYGAKGSDTIIVDDLGFDFRAVVLGDTYDATEGVRDKIVIRSTIGVVQARSFGVDDVLDISAVVPSNLNTFGKIFAAFGEDAEHLEFHHMDGGVIRVDLADTLGHYTAANFIL